MFFKLSKQLADNFTECYTLVNGPVLNTDEGWSEYQYADETVIILKGYANNYNPERLSEQLLFTRTPIVGNFHVYMYKGQS